VHRSLFSVLLASEDAVRWKPFLALTILCGRLRRVVDLRTVTVPATRKHFDSQLGSALEQFPHRFFFLNLLSPSCSLALKTTFTPIFTNTRTHRRPLIFVTNATERMDTGRIHSIWANTIASAVHTTPDRCISLTHLPVPLVASGFGQVFWLR
jgi:hypothetical protein